MYQLCDLYVLNNCHIALRNLDSLVYFKKKLDSLGYKLYHQHKLRLFPADSSAPMHPSLSSDYYVLSCLEESLHSGLGRPWLEYFLWPQVLFILSNATTDIFFFCSYKCLLFFSPPKLFAPILYCCMEFHRSVVPCVKYNVLSSSWHL